MALRADLSEKLDIGDLLQGLIGSLTDHGGELDSIPPPAADAEMNGAAAGVQVDTSAVTGAAANAAGGARTMLAGLPPASDALRPITGAITLVEQLAEGNIGGRVAMLIARLTTELQGEGAGGFAGALFRIAAALKDAPESAALGEVIRTLVGLTGANINLSAPVGDLVPAVQGASSAFAGLMSLESVLGESERLTGLLAAQLDAGEVTRRKAAILERFSSAGTTLAAFLASVDVANPGEVEAARAAMADLGAKLDDLSSYVIKGMAFGEATLAHLGPSKVLLEVQTAARVARDSDLMPTERLVGRGMEALQGMLSLDLSGAPNFTFEQILTVLEGQIAEMAAAIASFDMSALLDPLTEVFGAVTRVVDGVADVVERVTIEVRGALEQIRQVIAAIPIADIANAIRTALEPVVQAMDFITDMVGRVEDAIHEGVEVGKEVIAAIETTIDEFKAVVEGLFSAAREAIEKINLDQVIGTVTDGIRQFADLLARAQMKPYFDTAVDVIDVTATVVGAIPFGILPESMKADVDAAVKPIKDVDADAFQAEIENILQITPDGKFALRGDIEEAIRDVDEEIKNLLDTIAGFDPRVPRPDQEKSFFDQVNDELNGLAEKIRGLDASVALQPIQDAIQQVKDAITGFDLSAQLDPVRQVFTDILAAIDQYSPSQLIRPIEDKLDEVRGQLVATIKLDQWLPTIDKGVGKARELLDAIDPMVLAPAVAAALGQLRKFIDELPDVKANRSLGALVTLLASGSGLRIYPWSFDAVSDSIGGGVSGSQALEERATHIAEDLTSVRDAVTAVEPATLLADLSLQAQAVQTAGTALAARITDPTQRAAVEAAVALIDAGTLAGALAANRSRYLERLVSGVADIETLRRTGLSEVDETAGRIREALAPARPARDFVREALSHVGLADAELSLRGILRALLDQISPERLLGLLGPVYLALRERLEAIINAVAPPIREGVVRFNDLVTAFDLTPLREAVDAIVNEVKNQIMAMSPDALLAEPFRAWDEFREKVDLFDPIGELLVVIEELKAAAERILGKLHIDLLLATPMAIFDHIMSELRKLRLDGLLTPVFDQLDEIAHQVDDGLDRTVTSFKGLQEALPGGGGGGEASASVTVS